MTILLVSSSEDPASTNIKNGLLTKHHWHETTTFYETPVYQSTTLPDVNIITIPDKKIRHEHLEDEVNHTLNLTADLYIFLSRHRSKTGEPTLTVHPIGNYATAEFGGQPQTLVPAAPHAMAALLRRINTLVTQTKLPYKVCYEVTHHGPYLTTPTLFVEVGSTETQWKEQPPADLIATALLDTLPTIQTKPSSTPVLVGVGGGHYAPRFTDVALARNAAFGHMLPTYHLQDIIDESMLANAYNKTPGTTGFYLHRKELKKSQVTQVKKWCETQGIPVVSSNDLPLLTQ
jgi:D-aminoacyl-tRNA deacylase